MNSRKKFGIMTTVAGVALAFTGLVGAGAASAAQAVAPATGTITSHNTNGTAPTNCNATEWHWVITGISPTSVTSADVPASITVDWNVGADTVISLDDVTGGVAHYRYTGHLVDGDLPMGASATWPSPTAAVDFSEFNLSHGPCTEVVPTIPPTVPPTTEAPTTVPPTTEAPTTVPPTTEAPTTVLETTTTVEGEAGGPTTTVKSTTTVKGEAGGPTTVSSNGGGLPRTGSSQSILVALGLAMILGGLLFIALTRKPEEA